MKLLKGEYIVKHHKLDPYPIPKDKTPLFVNEPWLTDRFRFCEEVSVEPDDEEDNIRIYVPIDLNRKTILQRLNNVIHSYGEANEDNEILFALEVGCIIE